MQETIHKLKITTSKLNFELRINDVKIANEINGGAFSSIIPLNEWLILGANLVEIYILESDFDLDDASSIAFSYGTSAPDNDVFQATESLVYDDLHLSKKQSVTYTFNIKNLPTTERLNDLPIIDLKDTATIKKFYMSFRKLHAYFDQQNINGILDLCASRMDAHDKIFFELPGTEKSRFSEILNHVLPNEVILDFVEPKLSLKVYGQGRILTLEYDEYNLPAINAAPQDYSMTRSFFFFWALNKKGEFYIFR